MKKILIAGATGLIGRFIVETLAEHKDTILTVLVRRAVENFSKDIRQIVVDYEKGIDGVRIALGDESFDVAICAIGSTMRAAGSKAAFRKIEHDIPVILLNYCGSQLTPPKFIFISSICADQQFGFYLKTKHAVERQIFKAKVPYVIARPSLLLGERAEKRTGEKIAQRMLPGLFNALMASPLLGASWARRYRPVSAKVVASRIAREAITERLSGNLILEGDDFIVED